MPPVIIGGNSSAFLEIDAGDSAVAFDGVNVKDNEGDNIEVTFIMVCSTLFTFSVTAPSQQFN